MAMVVNQDQMEYTGLSSDSHEREDVRQPRGREERAYPGKKKSDV